MIFETIEQLLNEFFVDIHESNVGFSLGDLFDASHFRISDVFINTQVINALHLPLELAAGYIGDFKIEGLLGAVAGSPLTLLVSDVCLVLRRKDVDWTNELLARYTKDLLVALLQSFTSPSYAKKMQQSNASVDEASKKTFVSPAKWISSRFQAAIADMTVKLERIHIRIESKLNDQPIAYGAYISSIQFATRDVDEQILHRRMQRGITYPQAADGTRSKLVTLENLSVYCDLHADKFVNDSSKSTAAAADGAALHSTARAHALERFREKALRAFTPDPRRDLFFASVVWIKLDLSKSPSAGAVGNASAPTTASSTNTGCIAVAAVDIVTEALKVSVDFAQLSALTDELSWLSEFSKQTQMRQWRPSCIDRARVAPPVVRVANTALLPIVRGDTAALFAVTREQQRRTATWFRRMWQFAAWCVLVAKRKGNAHLVRFSMHRSAHPALDGDARSRRYVDLYTRSLSADALEMIVHGKKLLWTPASPRKPADAQQSQQHEVVATASSPHVPVFEPLTRAEQWELSDLVLHLSVAEQRRYRAVADAALREFKFKNVAPSASPAKPPTDSTPVAVAAAAPLQPPPASPTARAAVELNPISAASPAGSPSKTNTRPPDLPADSIAHHHITRSATESALPATVTKHAPSAALALAQLHVASTSALLGGKADARQSPTKAQQQQHQSLPMAKQRWVQQVFIPAWVLRKHPPLLNWSIGPISLCIFRDHAASAPSSPAKDSSGVPDVADASGAASRASPRCEFLKIGVERCTGAMLIGSALAPVFLVELRLGLVHATLFSPSHQRSLARPTRNNSVATDYIKDSDDGFLYVGLRYSPNADASALPADSSRIISTSTSTSTMDDPQLWNVQGKVCVGPIKIDYNELTLQTTLASAASIPLSKSLDIASATYLTILRDVGRSWRELYRRFRQRKQCAVARDDGFYSELLDPVGSAAAQLLERAQQHAAKRARLQQLLHTLLVGASAFELELSGLEATLSLLTSHVEQVLHTRVPQALLFSYEDIHVALPSTQFALESCPQRSECCVRAAGARVQFRSTDQGLAAATEYLLRRLVGDPGK